MIVLPVEGLLAPMDDSENLKGSPPVLEGQSLYSMLVATGSPVILLSSQREREVIEGWLNIEGYTRWVQLIHRGASPLSWYEFKLASINKLVAGGSKIRFYVDADPVTIAAVTDLGIPSLLSVSPGNRVGRKITTTEQSYSSWDTLVDTIETRSQTRANLAARRSLDVQEA